MRIVYADHKNPGEAAALAELEGRIDAWWRDFSARSAALARTFRTGGELGDLPKWMTTRLRAIIPHVCWEFGPGLAVKGFRLVITPENRHADRPRVNLLLSRAPELAGWEFYGYRPAESVELALQTVQGRGGGGIAGSLARAQPGRHGRIDLTILSPAYKDSDDRRALQDARIAVETILGEEAANRWIGMIKVEPLNGAAAAAADPRPMHAFELGRLKSTVEALVAAARAQLPPVPRWQRSHPFFAGAKRMALKPQPRKAKDYPMRQDLFVATTSEPALWHAQFSRRAFHSECFSRHGEVFCYLKIDAGEGFDANSFSNRASLESVLDKLLITAEAGCVIGGGMGLRYEYVDLALLDVDKAAKLIFSRLRRGKLPRRSWLLFFDSALADEWIGLYPDTPAPPMPP